MTPVLVADSNVLIEALLIPQSAAYVVAEMVARRVFDLATCQLCIEDTEDAIVDKLRENPANLDQVITSWEKLKADTRLIILAAPDATTANSAAHKYLGLVRHRADIPVLASALTMMPQPHVILSGNRGHFSDALSDRCGVKICSCHEFIELISEEL